MPPPHDSPSREAQHRPTSRRQNTSVITESRSHSPSLFSDSSEDEYLYVLGHANTTKEAIERIRVAQLPLEKKNKRFSSDLWNSVASHAQSITTAPDTDHTYAKRGGALPATREEFREYPRYIVSLTTSREGVFSDALSGFHSYVAREEEERDKMDTVSRYRDASHHEEDKTFAVKAKNHYVGTYDTQGGIVRTIAVPSLSPTMAQEGNTVLPAASASLATPAALDVKPTRGAEEEHTSFVATTVSVPPGTYSGNAGTPHVTEAVFLAKKVEKEAATPAVTGGEGFVSPHVYASPLARARNCGTDAMSQASSLSTPVVAHYSVTGDRVPCSPSVKSSAIAENIACTRPVAHSITTPPTKGAACESATYEKTRPTLAPPSTRQSKQAASVKAMHRHAPLWENARQRKRVPEVFRYRYSPDFEETIEENKLRNRQIDLALRNHERLVGPRGLTKEERQKISHRFADPNALDPEWPYVWEQFERDISRETLFVEDTPYHHPDDALAAISSYVEYCYDRGQQRIKEKSAAALAAIKKNRAPSITDASAPEEKNILGHFFSASATALKGAVVTMRANLPDFVGDPLLSISGYDPALYHATLLFPTDPKARSEKIFSAVREVVLASQQSFMGFPYQLLCEQVGTERLLVAMAELEKQQVDGNYLDEETEVEAPIPVGQTKEDLPFARNTFSLNQTSHHDAGAVQVHPYSHRTTTTGSSRNVHHEWFDNINALDARQVSESSCRPVSLTSSPSVTRTALTATLPDRADGKLVACSRPGQEVGEQPVAGLGTIPAHGHSEAQRRRRRRERMPLLVGEPRPHEFNAFLDVVRNQLASKELKERRRRRKELFRCEHMQEMLKRQYEEGSNDPFSPREFNLGSRESPPASPGPMPKRDGALLVPTVQHTESAKSPRKLFRDDIEGSIYLIPFRPAATAMESAHLCSPRLSLSNTSTQGVAASPETRGMRICLFFDEQRNVPVVVVNKLFRLLTIPGMGNTSSSEDDIPEMLNEETAADTNVVCPSVSAPRCGARRSGSLGNSLLLLVQVQFSLFMKEDVEIRWKWWEL